MIFSEIRVKDIHAILHYTPQALKFTAKNRNDHIIGIQLSGNATHYFADHQFTLDENCVYFFNQKDDYCAEITERGVCFSVHFTTYEPLDIKSFSVKIQDNHPILRMLNAIEQQFINAGGCSAKCLSELYKLFGCFEDIHCKKYAPKDERLTKAMEYIHLHFREKKCIVKAAEVYGVSARRFTDVFKHNFYTTPNQYIVNRKIDIAKKMLCSTELTIGDVAASCGFEDIYYFSKTFKKVTGQTATAYKKHCKC